MSANDSSVHERRIGRVAVLAVRGDIDNVTSPELLSAIRSALTSKPALLVVDLTDADFLASSGMAALIAGRHDAGEATQVAVVADRPVICKPLKLMGLDILLRLYPSLDDALIEFFAEAAGRNS